MPEVHSLHDGYAHRSPGMVALDDCEFKLVLLRVWNKRAVLEGHPFHARCGFDVVGLYGNDLNLRLLEGKCELLGVKLDVHGIGSWLGMCNRTFWI